MPGKYWTEKEEQMLRKMLEQGFSIEIIAEKLDRPVLGVNRKIKRLGLTQLVVGKEKISPQLTSLEPTDLMTHEQVLKVLSAALQRLQEPALDQEEVKRLKTLSVSASRYDALLERYERWDEIERRLEGIEAQLEEMASARQIRETEESG